MSLHPLIIVAAMTLCSFGGGLSLKQFSETRDVLWLVAGFSLYSLANCFFILIIDQNGVARALIIASAANILLTTAAGYAMGEKIGAFGIAAAALACLAAGLSLMGWQDADPPAAPPSATSEPETPPGVDV